MPVTDVLCAAYKYSYLLTYLLTYLLLLAAQLATYTLRKLLFHVYATKTCRRQPESWRPRWKMTESSADMAE